MQPDCIEVLSGKIPDPEVIVSMWKKTDTPVIAGGLITTKEDIKAVFHTRAAAVSTSTTALWQ